MLIIKGKLTCQNVRTFLTKWILKKTGNFQSSFVRKYHVFCFDFCCHGFSAKHMTFSFVVFMTLWHLMTENRPTGQVNPSQKSPDKSGLYLFAVIVFCFSYCSKRKLSIDFISSIYKFFSSPLSKLFFFFNSSFFFKVSFVLVFSRICWKRSNVSSNSRYNWV